MEQLAKYLKEREGLDSIVQDNGFASYRINCEECYIRDIWVDPEHRKSDVASEMADLIAEIAKKSGCKYLTGSVNTNVGDPTASTKVLLAYGFYVYSAITGSIWFRKDL